MDNNNNHNINYNGFEEFQFKGCLKDLMYRIGVVGVLFAVLVLVFAYVALLHTSLIKWVAEVVDLTAFHF